MHHSFNRFLTPCHRPVRGQRQEQSQPCFLSLLPVSPARLFLSFQHQTKITGILLEPA